MSRVLVVDDSDVINQLLKEFLTSNGFEVDTVETAQAAYDLLQKFKPDLILLDVQLPDVGGFEFCRIVRSQPDIRHIPIIMITATATQVTQKVKGLQAGADDYILKPFEMAELLERIRAVIRRSQAAPQALVVVPSAEPEEAPPVEPVPEDASAGISFLQALTQPTACDLHHVPGKVAAIFLSAFVAAATLGVFCSPSFPLRPVLVCGLAAAFWGLLVVLLVLASSISGHALRWREAACALSLAGVPLLLKLLGGLAFAAQSTLSPFIYTASPAVFGWPGFWIRRMDLFEWWAVGLLWILLRRNQSTRQVSVVTAVVYAGAVVAAFGLRRLII